MPDIAMCRDTACPSARRCYRSPESGTKPHDRQSWMEFRRLLGETSCPAFDPIEPRGVTG